MQYKIYINGKRHKVTLAGDDYKTYTTNVESGFTLPIISNTFDWSTATVNKANLSGKTLRFNGLWTAFKALYNYFNSSPVGNTEIEVIIECTNNYTIGIIVKYTDELKYSSSIEIKQATTTKGYVWSGLHVPGEAEDVPAAINSSLVLPQDLEIKIQNIELQTPSPSTSYDNATEKALVDDWLNRHLIVE